MKRRKYLLSLIILLIVFCLIYILNYYTPLFADDYPYSYSFFNGGKITNIKDIFLSQIAHYQVQNGRSVDHFLGQLFLFFGDSIFNIINSIAFCLLVMAVYYHGTGTLKNISIKHLLMYIGFIFLLTPAFGQSFLWITGSSNYLYSILMVLLFLVPYRNKAKNKNMSRPQNIGGGGVGNIPYQNWF